MNKSRYKLYRQGKKWVITVVSVATLGISSYSLLNSNFISSSYIQSAKADGNYSEIASSAASSAKSYADMVAKDHKYSSPYSDEFTFYLFENQVVAYADSAKGLAFKAAQSSTSENDKSLAASGALSLAAAASSMADRSSKAIDSLKSANEVYIASYAADHGASNASSENEYIKKNLRMAQNILSSASNASFNRIKSMTNNMSYLISRTSDAASEASSYAAFTNSYYSSLATISSKNVSDIQWAYASDANSYASEANSNASTLSSYSSSLNQVVNSLNDANNRVQSAKINLANEKKKLKNAKKTKKAKKINSARKSVEVAEQKLNDAKSLLENRS